MDDISGHEEGALAGPLFELKTRRYDASAMSICGFHDNFRLWSTGHEARKLAEKGLPVCCLMTFILSVPHRCQGPKDDGTCLASLGNAEADTQ